MTSTKNATQYVTMGSTREATMDVTRYATWESLHKEVETL